ncbi:uncharacterized protein LTHEOB_11865 [Lasiodiplodia theobromae]|uniref:uncharacterized protein n=1 Tax=Lasiodiplodia theobromae TaxID=45133 RepID=UPI0015C3E8BD|nr:uncharacterized protein LTHEOB_11865 [Lasiodiplodia theobromae]KAF4536858.1 hypothetical protein LTHEOB_11865 [Lasiodiplodia theobromae]
MDIVYNRASVTGGLISTQVTNQAQLDAVYMLTNFRAEDVRGGMRWVGDTPPPVINQQIFNHVLDFLEMVGRDRWYTRAWVVQEALCAGTKLLIALRRGPVDELSISSKEIPRWLFPLGSAPHLLDHCKIRHGSYIGLSRYNHGHDLLRTDGVHLRAYLWTVEERLDFTPIQLKHAETWNSLKCLKFNFAYLKDDTHEDFQRRQRLVTEKFAKNDFLMQQVQNVLNTGTRVLPSNLPGLESISDEAFTITNFVNFHRVEGNIRMQRVLADVIFAILRFLYHNREIDPRATGLANSIWQSIRVDTVDENRADLPDEVGEVLFNHPDIVANPFATLQLDKTRDDTYSQIWFVDRIMRDGHLWIGRYNRAPSMMRRKLGYRGIERKADLPQAKSSTSGTSKGKKAAIVEEKSIFPEDTILRRQLRLWMARLFVDQSSFSESLGESSHSAQIDTNSLVGYMDVVSRGIWQPEAEERRVEGLVSAFDVDGPSLISTLYDGNWEVLPRPEIRSMSVCWVLESVHYRKASTEEQVTSVREMDPEDAMKTSEMEEDTDCAYKVLDKVKGLWQLMDYPLQQYTFI